MSLPMIRSFLNIGTDVHQPVQWKMQEASYSVLMPKIQSWSFCSTNRWSSRTAHQVSHIHTMLWKASDRDELRSTDISKHGWNMPPTPVYYIAVVTLKPKDLLQVISCKGTSDRSCIPTRCSCHDYGITGTTYCQCKADINCNNTHMYFTW